MSSYDYTRTFAQNGQKTDISDSDYKGGWYSVVGGQNGIPTVQQFNTIMNEMEGKTNEVHATAQGSKEKIANLQQLQQNTEQNLEMHLKNTQNPHDTTKEQIGLGYVDNTPDADKPVSTAQRAAIDDAYYNSNLYTDEKIAALINGAPSTLDTLKEIADAMAENEDVVNALEAAVGTKANEAEFSSHVNDKNNPHRVDKEQIGLGNVPNVATNNQTPTFTRASERTNIGSGEKLSVILGKINKFFADLKTVAFSGSYSDLSNKPTASDIGALPTTGGTVSGEIISTSANGFRIAYKNYGFFIRNDGTKTYFLLTDEGDATGTFNSLRPLSMDNATGLVTFSNGLKGTLTGNADTATRASYVGSDAKNNGLSVRTYVGTPSEKAAYIFLQEDFENNCVNVGIDGLGGIGVNKALRATQDGNGKNIANTYLPKSGGTMTGNLYLGTPYTYVHGETTTLNLCGSGYINLRSPGIQCRNYANTGWSGISASSFTTKDNSSRKLKDNIEDITDERATQILDVKVVTFDYKEGVAAEEHRYNRTGVIAEDTERVCPEVINYDNDNEPSGVQYDRFIPYLIKMVQLQQADMNALNGTVTEQSKVIAKQNDTINKLLKRIERMESRMITE